MLPGSYVRYSPSPSGKGKYGVDGDDRDDWSDGMDVAVEQRSSHVLWECECGCMAAASTPTIAQRMGE